MNMHPSLIHVTHWKAGSQWIHKILRICFPEKIIQPTLGNVQFVHQQIEIDRVYPTVYVTREEFNTAILPENCYCFIVIRDLRDTLVSGYYSIKFSHPPMGQIAEWRKILNEINMEQGLIYLMKHWLPDSAAIQHSWLNTTKDFLKYEDLLEQDVEMFSKIIIKQAKMDVSPSRLEEAIISARFENVTGGRQLGQENIAVHERKGMPGDWKNKFSEKVKNEFKVEYGDLLIKAGYAKDKSW
jgi:hypothetical protein